MHPHGNLRFEREGHRTYVVTRRVRAAVEADDAFAAVRFAFRSATPQLLTVPLPGALHAGPLCVTRQARSLEVRVNGEGHGPSAQSDDRVQLDLSPDVPVRWARELGRAPVEWDVDGPHVTLASCGQLLWRAGPQTAATFGIALGLTLEHAGVFFGSGAPLSGVSLTALTPQVRGEARTIRVAAYEQKKYGLSLHEVCQLALAPDELREVQRQLVGVLRALTLEAPAAIPALRILEALVR